MGMTTPERQARRRERYAADKANPKPCGTAECPNAAVPLRKWCYACKGARYREQHGHSYIVGYRARTKAAAIAAYGGECRCCGETEPMFLALDHIEGGGGQHRKEVHGRVQGNMWAWAKYNGYPDSLRLLCNNCNFAEYLGGCPHQKKGENNSES